MRPYFPILFVLTLSSCMGQNPSLIDRSEPGPDRPLAILLDSLNIRSDQLEIRIDKSEYLLSLWKDSVQVKSYAVVFGSNPVDDKLREGDECTPEGIFGIRDQYPHRKWSKFIWIDYPNDDARAKHARAKAEGRIPAEAGIGGEVGIHGVPPGFDFWIDRRYNWTLGCISLKNEDVDEVYSICGPQTRIVITK